MTGYRQLTRRIAGSAMLSIVVSCLAPQAMQADEPMADSGRDPIAIYKEAGIDTVQEERIRAMATEYERDSAEKAAQIIRHLREIRNMSLNPDLDAKTILNTQREVNKIQSEMALDKINLLIKIRSVLRPDQKRKLVSLLQKSRSKDAQPQ